MTEPRLRLVDHNGEVHDGCPDCQERDDLIAGLERSVAKLERQIRAMSRDREQERLSHRHRQQVEQVHEFWQACTGRKGKLGARRFDAVAALLSLGEEEWKLRLAVIGAAVSPNCSESTGEPYDDLELVCRDETRMDSFARRGWLWGQRWMA